MHIVRESGTVRLRADANATRHKSQARRRGGTKAHGSSTTDSSEDVASRGAKFLVDISHPRTALRCDGAAS